MAARHLGLRSESAGGGQVNPDQWKLARRIEALVRHKHAFTDAQLASELGVPVSQIGPVVAVLARQRRVDIYAGYVVPAAKAQDERPPT